MIFNNTKPALVSFLVIISLITFFQLDLSAQGSRKVTGKKYQEYIDSLKTMEYKQVFPIWGDKAYKRGYDIPFPYGVMLNYYMQDADVSISNLEVGFQTPDNTVGPIPLDSLVVFDVSSARSFAASFRPDIWIFPFLNVYGLFSAGKNSTTVKLAQPVPIEAVTDFSATGYGFGVLFAAGVGPGWITVDNNFIWTIIPALADPVRVHNLGIRFGATKQFRRKPESNFAAWIGAFRQNLASETRGAIDVNELFPNADEELADRIEIRWDDYISDKNCGGAIQHPACRLDPLVRDITDKLRTDQPISETTILYSMDKKPVELWNLVIGGQYQFDKHWQLRSEVGFLGSRTQFLFSLNYRFLL
jgi:hypothetical protein